MTAWTVIQHTELGSAQAQIDFNSIPTTYTDLLLVVSARSTRPSIVSDNIALRFNGSTSGYTWIRLYGTGSSVGSDSATTDRLLVEAQTASSATSNTFGSGSIYIPNYRSSAPKVVSSDGVAENNAAGSYLSIASGIWSGTDPITSIRIFPWESNNFVQYSSATLYGILKGSAGGVTVS